MKTRPHWCKVGPNPVTGVFLRGGETTGTQGGDGQVGDHGGRGWSDTSTNRKMPRTAATPEAKRKARETPSPAPLGKHGPANPWSSGLWPPACETVHVCCLKPQPVAFHSSSPGELVHIRTTRTEHRMVLK